MEIGPKAENKQGAKVIKQLILSQFGIAVCLSLLFMFFLSAKAAYSAFLAGMVAVIPNSLFAYRLFNYSGAQSAKFIVNSLYRGEAIKLITTIILLAIIFRFLPVAAMPFFATYMLAFMVFWIFLLRVK